MRCISPITLALIAICLAAAAGFIVLALRGTTLPLSAVDADLLDDRTSLVREWVAANQRTDGSFPYSYDPVAGTYGSDDNVIRQLIAVQGIFALGHASNDPAMLEAGERARAYMFKHQYRYDARRRWGYFEESDGIKLGAAALGILATREQGDPRRALTQEELALGRFLLAMQRSDGSFQTFLQDEATDTNDRFYSGEALTALALLARASSDTSYDTALAKSFPYYRQKLKKDFWPQYAPWHMQAYTIAYEETGNEEYADYVFWLAEGLIQTMLEGDSTARAKDRGRFYNAAYPAWGVPHSSSTGIYTEGLTYAYALAVQKNDKEKIERYRAAIRMGLRSLFQVQWLPGADVPDPRSTVGAFAETVDDGDIRVDQVGHALNALARVRLLGILR